MARDLSSLALVEARATMLAEAEASRDDAIRKASADGWSYRAISERAGVSTGSIHTIVRAGQEAPPLVVGALVRLTHPVERNAGVGAPAGSTGVVSYLDPDLLEVRLDEPVEGLEDWGNALQWSLRDGDDPDADLEVLG